MKKTYIFATILLLVTSIMIVPGTIQASGQSSADYTIETDVLSSGGQTVTSADYTISGTIGQPAIIGTSSSTDYDVGHGFWPRMSEPCLMHGDVNGSGSISAEDAQIAFFIVLGMHTPTSQELCAADCDGSGSITAQDAQTIFFSILGMGSCVDPIPGNSKSLEIISPLQAQTSDSQHDMLNVSWSDELWVEHNIDGFNQVLISDFVIANQETPVDAFTISVFYNSNDWQFTGCAEGQMLTSWFQFDCEELEPGHLVIAAYTVDDAIEIDTQGILFSLKFNMLWNETAETGFRVKLDDDLKTFRIYID